MVKCTLCLEITTLIAQSHHSCHYHAFVPLLVKSCIWTLFCSLNIVQALCHSRSTGKLLYCTKCYRELSGKLSLFHTIERLKQRQGKVMCNATEEKKTIQLFMLHLGMGVVATPQLPTAMACQSKVVGGNFPLYSLWLFTHCTWCSNFYSAYFITFYLKIKFGQYTQ